MSFLSMLGLFGEQKVASNLGPDNVHRPVHHSEIIVLQAMLTRPADTTNYAAGDAIGEAGNVVFEFNFGALGLPAGFITHARLIREDTAATAPRFVAHIHDALPATLPVGDNAAHPLLWANRASRRGLIDFAAARASDAAGGTCLEYGGVLSTSTGGIPFVAADGRVRAVLTTRDAFTPGSAKGYLLELGAVA
ncbi:hypothetical protein [Phenylobacterium sp.]|uniref:hypothetical protein n=1 Tax=Phenylobacterium sp. TaxID=1871053 RepID=UPI002732215F|nr:hypothetical protein [Phenylobacterium sp.]MDP1617483.1 hypothetical protein [Phenylobacterium sp.]MDP1986779.1 hypothetical protein [Phenylobacterium sp.]